MHSSRNIDFNRKRFKTRRINKLVIPAVSISQHGFGKRQKD
jgi:hypothetical protein